MANFISTIIGGVEIVNVTPHNISFQGENGEKIDVPASGIIISADPREESVRTRGGVEFVKTVFVGCDTGWDQIDVIESAPAAAGGFTRIIVGSIIAAQAYPGAVVAMTPAAGYERVAPAEKRMNPFKFTTFA